MKENKKLTWLIAMNYFVRLYKTLLGPKSFLLLLFVAFGLQYETTVQAQAVAWPPGGGTPIPTPTPTAKECFYSGRYVESIFVNGGKTGAFVKYCRIKTCYIWTVDGEFNETKEEECSYTWIPAGSGELL